jgi:CBS domain containing-hemolysin-like protein
MVSPAALALTVLMSAIAALCAAADGALLSLDPERGRLPDSARELAARRERAHRALAFGRVAAHLAAGASLAAAFEVVARPPGEGALVALIGAAVAVFLSESLARSAGDDLGARAASALLPVIATAERVLAPVIHAGLAIERGLDRLLPRRPPAEEERDATAEQFREIVAAEADVSTEEATLLHGVFELGDTQVHEIMVPRVDIVGVASDTPWSEVVDRARSSGHARLPVYEETIDDVGGMLYAKDLLAPVIAGEEPEGGWQRLIRSAEFIPGTKTIDQQLRDFQASRTHIAIVVDEFGGTAGLVTIEDILEEIVGEIRDEYDVEEPPIVKEEGGRKIWVSGRVPIDELSEAADHDFSREGVTSVGGLVFDLLGRVPLSGEEFSLDGFRVVVERVRRRRIERVYFERAAPEESAG